VKTYSTPYYTHENIANLKFSDLSKIAPKQTTEKIAFFEEGQTSFFSCFLRFSFSTN